LPAPGIRPANSDAVTVNLVGSVSWLLERTRGALSALRNAHPSRAASAAAEQNLATVEPAGQVARPSPESDIDPRIAEIIEAIPRRRFRRPA
jgi:hypothetical protein